MLEDCPAILLLEAAMTGHHKPQLPAITGGKMKSGRARETPHSRDEDAENARRLCVEDWPEHKGYLRAVCFLAQLYSKGLQYLPCCWRACYYRALLKVQDPGRVILPAPLPQPCFSR